MLWAIATRGDRIANRLARDQQLTAVGVVGAVDQAGELRASGAQQTGETDDLTRVDVQVDGCQCAPPAHADRAEVGDRLGPVRDQGGGASDQLLEGLQGPSDHLLHQVDAGQLGGEVLPDELPVAQDGHPVADLIDLVEEVRDEQDRHTLAAQRTQDVEQLGDLVGVQARGGLVEHEDPSVDHHRPADRDQLLDREGVRGEG